METTLERSWQHEGDTGLLALLADPRAGFVEMSRTKEMQATELETPTRTEGMERLAASVNAGGICRFVDQMETNDGGLQAAMDEERERERDRGC